LFGFRCGFGTKERKVGRETKAKKESEDNSQMTVLLAICFQDQITFVKSAMKATTFVRSPFAVVVAAANLILVP